MIAFVGMRSAMYEVDKEVNQRIRYDQRITFNNIQIAL
jgi:hypothetical protein